MFEFLRKNKVIIVMVTFCLVAVAGFTIFNHFNKQASEPVSFAWDNEERELATLGVDSSGLRVAYRYSLNPSSYHPMYEKSNCSVVSVYQSYSGEKSEKTATDELLRGYSGNNEARIRDVSVRYNFTETTVPVRFLAYESETDGLFHVVFGRVFNTEGKQLVVDLACETESLLDSEFVNVLDAVVITDKTSKF